MNRFLNILLAALTALGALAYDEPKSDYYFMEGLRRQSIGQEDAALRFFERAYELNPQPDSEIAKQVAFGRISVWASDSLAFNSAVRMARRYVDLNGSDAYAAFALGDVYARASRFDLACRMFEMADSLCPDQSSIAMRLATALEFLGESERALDVWERIEEREGVSPPTAFRISRLRLIEMADTVGALAEVDRLIEHYPSDPDAISIFCSAYEAADRGGDIGRVIDRAIELDPENAALRQARIKTTYDLAGPDGLEQLLRQRIDSVASLTDGADDVAEVQDELTFASFYMKTEDDQTDLAPVLTRLWDYFAEKTDNRLVASVVKAKIHVDAANLEAGLADLEEACRLDPTVGTFWSEIVRLRRVLGDEEGAIEAGERGLRTPNLDEDINLRYILASAYMGTENYEKATEVIRPVAENDSLPEVMRGEMYGLMADAQQFFAPYAQAEASYEKAMALSPDNATIINNFAYMIAEHGSDFERAASLIEKALDKGGRSPVFLDTAAWVEYRRGNYERARELINEAIALVSGGDVGADYLLHAGDIYYRLGLNAEALDFWQRGLEIAPESDELRQRVELKKIPE